MISFVTWNLYDDGFSSVFPMVGDLGKRFYTALPWTIQFSRKIIVVDILNTVAQIHTDYVLNTCGKKFGGKGIGGGLGNRTYSSTRVKHCNLHDIINYNASMSA